VTNSDGALKKEKISSQNGSMEVRGHDRDCIALSVQFVLLDESYPQPSASPEDQNLPRHGKQTPSEAIAFCVIGKTRLADW
jgi:hypothetical protein